MKFFDLEMDHHLAQLTQYYTGGIVIHDFGKGCSYVFFIGKNGEHLPEGKCDKTVTITK